MQGFYVRIVLCPLVLLLCLRLAAAQSTPAAPKPEKRYSMTFSVNIQNLQFQGTDLDRINKIYKFKPTTA